MLIAEDLLQLLIEPRTGAFVLRGPRIDFGLAGAVLTELAQADHVRVVGDEDKQAGRLVTGPPPATGADSVLRDAYALVRDGKERSPTSVLPQFASGLRYRLLDRLTDAGVVERTWSKTLGPLHEFRWPVIRPAHADELRRSIDSVLVRGVTPDALTRPVVAILAAAGGAHKVLGTSRGDLNKRVVRKRANEIADGDWVATAVRQAIRGSRLTRFVASTLHQRPGQI